ncbi:MAG: tripartite tricarboxylate transporter substrate binding protein [Comamonadaceae bacterium]|nr:MAG: tripartite tricarboxylate transporter substrate binding protein [Comamonadaceae bacterium]
MTLTRRTILRAVAAATGAAALTGGARAAEFPVKPVRVVVPFPAGSLGDILVRGVSMRSADQGVSFVVDNKPGGNTFIAMATVANAPADGYTLAQTTVSTDVLNPMLYARMPYDPASLTPLALLGYSPFVFVVPAEFKAESLADVVAMAKASPGSLNFGSAGIGNATQLVTEKLMREASIRMTHVPFNGSQPVHQALMRNDVQVYSDVLTSALPHIKSGKFRILAITSTQRHPVVPNAPTMIESGFPNFVMSAWYGLQAPRATPPEAMERMVAAIDRTLVDPTMISDFAARGMVLFPPGGPKLMAQQIATDRERWGGIVRALDLKLEQ